MLICDSLKKGRIGSLLANFTPETGSCMTIDLRPEPWSSLAFTVVLGNHDRGAGQFYSDCGFACADAPALIGGIECRHHPIARDNVSGPLALAGHVHPVVRLNGLGRDSLRTPCFVMSERQIVLPAFGEFVGGSLVTSGEGERALIATTRGVFDVTRGTGGAARRL